MIYFDSFETWSGSFGELITDLVGKEVVDNMAVLQFEDVEDAGEHVANLSTIRAISTAIEKWLRQGEFCVFHGTRLLPEEILSVEKEGLRPLLASERKHRLRKILKRHPKWHSVKHKLDKVLEDVGPKEKQGRREGQVHFSLSRSGLVNYFNHYLTHGSEFDQHVVQRLFDDKSGLRLLSSETRPVLVHISISGDELIRGAHPHFGYNDIIERGDIPGLAQTFLNAWAFKLARPSFDIASLRTDCCLMQRVPTPVERVLEMEQPSELEAH